jgi:2-polyprenyl-6-methoxyphenol hydroxylase-like FAD-dependent oxidoreductase
MVETDVLIVGAGPVGLTLSMMLAKRGVKATTLEMRAKGEPPPVKSNHVSARSMEIFRRLGIARQIRDTGLPADWPGDVSFRTTTTGRELSRILIPCRRDRYTSREGPDTWWPTPEPAHRLNQIYLEPALLRLAEQTPGITILDRTSYESHTQDDGGVTATARDLITNDVVQVRSRFLVGCDGGRSEVRHAIGAGFSGTPVIQRVQSSYIRAPGLLAAQPAGPAWSTLSFNPRRNGTIFAIDGHETWLVFNYLRPDEEEYDSVDRDWCIRTILGVGPDFEIEILSTQDWVGRRLVADRFRDRRVFICGDAAHVWVPYGGYAMNAGIADAENLGWLLAAHLHGWAPDAILDAYTLERQPITEQVSHYAMNHAEAMIRQRGNVPPEIEDDTPAGEAAREALGKSLYDLNVLQYCAAGLNFGYFYDRSPLIVYDDEAAPPYTMGTFTPSSVPGCRTPHVWLADGRSLYDVVGSGYALLRFDRTLNVDGLLQAAEARGVPFTLVDIDPDRADGIFTHRLLISRPDQHVAWRANEPPADPLALVDRLRGAAGAARMAP